MRYLKCYESIKNEPEIGDWVICKYCKSWTPWNQEGATYIGESIGRIVAPPTEPKDGRGIRVTLSYINQGYYYVEYYNVPKNKNIRNIFWNINDFNTGYNILVDRKNILAFSKNKEELDIIIAANKYNL